MFSKKMIAPCGLDCNICIGRLKKALHVQDAWERVKENPYIVINCVK